MIDPISMPDDETDLDLRRISTRWSEINEPALFAMRYAPAIRNYLHALVRDPTDAEDVAQEFLLQVTRSGFNTASPERGRFRHYLITAVRNAARAWYQRKQSKPDSSAASLPEYLIGEEDSDRWLAEWRRCLLERTWQALDRHEKGSPGNLAGTVLRLVTESPDASSEELAREVERSTGQAMRPEAFRKQRSRARRLFAELLAEEVSLTLHHPTPQEIQNELAELGFLGYVQPYLSETD